MVIDAQQLDNNLAELRSLPNLDHISSENISSESFCDWETLAIDSVFRNDTLLPMMKVDQLYLRLDVHPT